MFKNTKSQLLTILIFAIISTLISYSIIDNPFSLSVDTQSWFIRISLYIIFFIWLNYITELITYNDILIGLSVSVIFISVLSTDTRTLCYFNFMSTTNFNAILGFINFGILLFLLLFFLFECETVFGCLILFNTIISMFLFLPFGLPRIQIVLWEKISFPCYPLYTIDDYSPFFHEKSNILSILLDIRTLSAIIFAIYILATSLHKTIKSDKEYYFEDKIVKIENSFVQFVFAGIYFIWNILLRVLFFIKSFFKILIMSIWDEIKSSTKSYLHSILIILTFISSMTVLSVSFNIFDYIKIDEIRFPSVSDLWFIFKVAFLILIPIFYLQLYKSNNLGQLKVYKFDKKDRPKLFIPIYTFFFGIGLSSVFNCFLFNRISIIAVVFLTTIVFTIIWGYRNYYKKGII